MRCFLLILFSELLMLIEDELSTWSNKPLNFVKTTTLRNSLFCCVVDMLHYHFHDSCSLDGWLVLTFDEKWWIRNYPFACLRDEWFLFWLSKKSFPVGFTRQSTSRKFLRAPGYPSARCFFPTKRRGTLNQ